MRRIAVAALLAVAILPPTGASTAANAVASTTAGQAVASISGYSLSAPSFRSDPDDPRLVVEARFTLDAPSPSTVGRVMAGVASGELETCSLVSTTAVSSRWACPVPLVALTAISQITVGAAQ